MPTSNRSYKEILRRLNQSVDALRIGIEHQFSHHDQRRRDDHHMWLQRDFHPGLTILDVSGKCSDKEPQPKREPPDDTLEETVDNKRRRFCDEDEDPGDEVTVAEDAHMAQRKPEEKIIFEAIPGRTIQSMGKYLDTYECNVQDLRLVCKDFGSTVRRSLWFRVREDGTTQLTRLDPINDEPMIATLLFEDFPQEAPGNRDHPLLRGWKQPMLPVKKLNCLQEMFVNREGEAFERESFTDEGFYVSLFLTLFKPSVGREIFPHLERAMLFILDEIHSLSRMWGSDLLQMRIDWSSINMSIRRWEKPLNRATPSRRCFRCLT
ncbi:hypothetical protein B0J13DRAFT_633721 [Dactylonectria estremocensis]|uniref:Uncharacterized protein n=1 Tax=Dactylonectria estremocensis TaxID=1079267 RepID=A0A9P9JEK0_9HYPO|nr:hypothetical protein B0J13DRAFT_633721 [Dactylonectria estremocensis]